MIIRVDKCVTFGVKKFSSRSFQYEPKLFINTELVPTAKSGKFFKYLVDTLIFEVDNKIHKEKLKSSLSDMLRRIDTFPVLSKNKLLLYQRYILTVATLSKPWVIQHFDNIASSFVRQWLDLPNSATFSGISLPYSQFGLNLQLPSVKFRQCQTVLRSCLRSSSNDGTTSLWKSTSHSMNVQYDSYKNTNHVRKMVPQEHKVPIKCQLKVPIT